MYDNIHGMGVDPRNIAQRIMEVLHTACSYRYVSVPRAAQHLAGARKSCKH